MAGGTVSLSQQAVSIAGLLLAWEFALSTNVDHTHSFHTDIDTEDIAECFKSNGTIPFRGDVLMFNYTFTQINSTASDNLKHAQCHVTVESDIALSFWINTNNCDNVLRAGITILRLCRKSRRLYKCRVGDETHLRSVSCVVDRDTTFTLKILDPIQPVSIFISLTGKELHTVRHVSPTSGYIEMFPGNSVSLRFQRTLKMTFNLIAPAKHFTFVTYPYGLMIDMRQDIPRDEKYTRYPVHMLFISHPDNDTQGESVEKVYADVQGTRQFKSTKVTVVVKGFPSYVWSSPFRIIFSYHVNSKMPEQLPDGQWNCSVPHWPKFAIHFRCNLVKDCIHGEDEADCSYRKHCDQGQFAAGDRCYAIIRRNSTFSREEAKRVCRGVGGYIASMNTNKESGVVSTVLNSMINFGMTFRMHAGLQYQPDIHQPS